MFLSFHEERFDRERGEKCFGFGDVGDGFGTMSGEKTGVGVFGDAGAGDQIAAGQEIDDAAQFFGESIWIFPGPTVRATGFHELDGANAGGGRFDEGREHEGVMQENVADLLLAVARARFDYEMKTTRQGLARSHPRTNTFIFRRFV